MKRTASVGLLTILVLFPAGAFAAGPRTAAAAWAQVGKLSLPGALPGDLAASSVAISADGSTVVFGVPSRPLPGSLAAGVVSVWVRPAGGWGAATETARLQASDAAPNDALGSAVAISADGSTIVAGAPGKSVAGLGSGAALVFVRSPGGWWSTTESARLSSSGPGGALGGSVAVSSDGATVAAGAPYDSEGGGAAQGSVYLFRRPAGGWANGSQSALLLASDGTPNDFLGISVGISSDGSTVAAGAHGKDIYPNQAQGAVYVFTRPAAGWSGVVAQAGRLTSADGTAGGTLGFSTAISADASTVVAGAPNIEVGPNVRQGAAYVFVRRASGWADAFATATLHASDGAAEDLLGTAVAASADGRRVAVGAPGRTSAGRPASGAVYLFERPGAKWSKTPETELFVAADGAGRDALGQAAALAADGGTVVGGAPRSPQAVARGAAYVFSGSSPSDLLLQGGRVKVSLSWKSPYTGETGAGLPLPQRDAFGYFSFGDPGNPEVYVKALDFGPTVPYLVFFAGLTSFEYSVTFTNISNGRNVTFVKPAGSFAGGADTTSLPQ